MDTPTNPGTELVRVQDESLSPDERRALEIGRRAEVPRVAPETSARFFELFLLGRSCKDIQKLNPGFSLAQVVLARVEHAWDRQREEYVSRMLDQVRDRVLFAQLDNTLLLADLMRAHSKFLRPKLDRFILTGDESELQGIKLGDMKNLKELVELLLKSTGQDKSKEKEGGNHLNLHLHSNLLPGPQVVVPLTSEQADEVLKRVEAKGS